MGLSIEGGSRVSDWEAQAEKAKTLLVAEWEEMRMGEVFGQVQQSWGGGEVLSPEISIVEVATPNSLLIGVHGSEMTQHLVLRDPQDGSVQSQFTVALRYTASQQSNPFSVWVEDAERRPDDDYPLRAGQLDRVTYADGESTDYTREIYYHPNGRESVRKLLLRRVGNAIQVRREKGLLPLPAPSLPQARRIA